MENSGLSGKNTALAGHIRSIYQTNAEAKNAVTESIWLAKLAADMQYDPGLLAKIAAGIGGSATYYPVIRVKARSAAAWIKKILATANKPWSITPTPDPDLDNSTVDAIASAAMAEGERLSFLGMEMTPEDYYDFALDMRNLIMQQRNTRAADAAAAAEQIIADRMVESGFAEAFDAFLSDFTLYSAAFMRAVVTMDKVSKVEKQTDPQRGTEIFVRTEKFQEMQKFERISPARVFPSPGQVGPDDDDIVIVSLYSLKEISDMAALPGYNRHEIECLLEEFNALSADYQRDPLDSFPEAKLYSADNDRYRRASRLAALEFYGKASGKAIKEWCLSGVSAREEELAAADDDTLVMDEMTGRWIHPSERAAMATDNEENDSSLMPTPEKTEEELYDCGIDFETLQDNQFYEIFAISIHDRVVFCRVSNSSSRWLFSASFERNQDSIWGLGIADTLRHIQQDANSVRRATINNLNLTSYPQVIVNDDALAQFAPGQRSTALIPGMTWHVRNSFAGVTRPIDFVQIPSAYSQLAAEFERILVMADRVSGIPEYSQGLASGAKNGAAGTASGLSMLLEAAGNQIKDPINNLDKGVIEPIVRAFYYSLLDDPEVPNEAKGDFKIVALGANGLIFREQLAQKRRDFLQLVLASPLLQQIIKPEGITALIREVADSLNMETDDLVPTKTELIEQRIMTARQQEQQQQLEAAGIIPPPVNNGDNNNPASGEIPAAGAVTEQQMMVQQ